MGPTEALTYFTDSFTAGYFLGPYSRSSRSAPGVAGGFGIADVEVIGETGRSGGYGKARVEARAKPAGTITGVPRRS